MLDIIFPSLAILLSLPTSVGVWNVAQHASQKKLLRERSAHQMKEDANRSELLQKEDRNRAMAAVAAEERKVALEQKQIKAERDRADAEVKAAAKALRDEQKRVEMERIDAEEAAEQKRIAALRRASLVESGHQLWKLHTEIRNVPKDRYSTKKKTYYYWECNCGQQSGTAVEKEIDAILDFQDHQEIRTDHRGSEHGVSV